MADLHRHLDGSLRRSTLEELADSTGTAIPQELGFLPGMGLSAALACFETSLSVLQRPAAVERVAGEICEDASSEGVSTLEIRFAPQLHRGAPMEEIVDAAISGVAGRASLILCGLFGEPPRTFDRFLEIAKGRPLVVGIDLAGGPDSGQEWQLDDYADPFAKARDLGLGRTVHAGEGRPCDEIRRAILHLHAQRIGHATSLLEDPRVADLALTRQVTLEACITSNWHTAAIPSIEDHPIARWLGMGQRVCINTDNTLFSRTDSRTEHARALAIPGMDRGQVERAIACGHQAAFELR